MPSRQLRTLAAFVLVTSPAFAAHVTDVADAADERHPLEVDIDVTYIHTRSETRISRERPGTAGVALVDEPTTRAPSTTWGSGSRSGSGTISSCTSLPPWCCATCSPGTTPAASTRRTAA